MFASDPALHLYGLADLEEPYWSRSMWWRDGDAVVGVIGFPGSPDKAVYAMSSNAPDATLELLVNIGEAAPPDALVTGPRGLADRLRTQRPVVDLGVHWRLVHDGGEAAPSSEVVMLGTSDVAAIADLHDTDPGAAFFLPHMVENGVYVGVWDGGRLVASAGTHVVSDRHGVAAIGAVITAPSHRGRGLGAAVTETLTALLIPRFGTVGLNVAEANAGALRLYERLGFVRTLAYEEIALG